MDLSVVTQNYLLYFILPLWLLAGIADWWCHRRTHIDQTSGAKESIIHLLMLLETGLPLLVALFFQVNALVIALIVVAFVLHEATALWDVSYAVKHRHVSPFEQHVHSFLEMLPLMAGSVILLLHWPQTLALVGLGDAEPDWSLRLKEPPLPLGYVFSLLSAVVLLELLPYGEELWRTWRARRYAAPD